MPNVSIENLDKAAVLKALFDAATVPPKVPAGPMSEAMAKRFIDAGQLRFDYVSARALKVDIATGEFDSSAYDEANGAGSAEKAIAALRGPVVEAVPVAVEPEPEPEPEAEEKEEDDDAPPGTETQPAPVAEAEETSESDTD